MGQIAAALLTIVGPIAMGLDPEANGPGPFTGGCASVIGLAMYVIETRRAWRHDSNIP